MKSQVPIPKQFFLSPFWEIEHDKTVLVSSLFTDNIILKNQVIKFIRRKEGLSF